MQSWSGAALGQLRTSTWSASQSAEPVLMTSRKWWCGAQTRAGGAASPLDVTQRWLVPTFLPHGPTVGP